MRPGPILTLGVAGMALLAMATPARSDKTDKAAEELQFAWTLVGAAVRDGIIRSPQNYIGGLGEIDGGQDCSAGSKGDLCASKVTMRETISAMPLPPVTSITIKTGTRLVHPRMASQTVIIFFAIPLAGEPGLYETVWIGASPRPEATANFKELLRSIAPIPKETPKDEAEPAKP